MRSIIGRFLEHSRIFYFHAAGTELVLLSSADWMDRNFFRRVELAFPLLDAKLKARVINEGLRIHLRDNVLSWLMDSTGRYVRRRARSVRYDGQQHLLDQLRG